MQISANTWRSKRRENGKSLKINPEIQPFYTETQSLPNRFWINFKPLQSLDVRICSFHSTFHRFWQARLEKEKEAQAEMRKVDAKEKDIRKANASAVPRWESFWNGREKKTGTKTET